MPVLVKIEGLRDPQTAVAVAALGADVVGLVFASSPRQVTVEQARQVVTAVGQKAVTVGVFVNFPADEINRVVAATGIRYVQLHGDEGPQMVGQVQAPCIKAFRVRDEHWREEVEPWLAHLPDRSNLQAILLDAYDAFARGGTGRRFNWEWIQSSGVEGLPPIVLAGGLDPECVAQAIRTVQPWMVDVASGVESAPGVKDLDKVKTFIEAAKGAL